MEERQQDLPIEDSEINRLRKNVTVANQKIAKLEQ